MSGVTPCLMIKDLYKARIKLAIANTGLVLIGEFVDHDDVFLLFATEDKKTYYIPFISIAYCQVLPKVKKEK